MLVFWIWTLLPSFLCTVSSISHHQLRYWKCMWEWYVCARYMLSRDALVIKPSRCSLCPANALLSKSRFSLSNMKPVCKCCKIPIAPFPRFFAFVLPMKTPDYRRNHRAPSPSNLSPMMMLIIMPTHSPVFPVL